MKTKYRVKQVDDAFYPQYRFLFMWFSFKSPYSGDLVRFDSLDSAFEFIERKQSLEVYHYPKE